MIHRRERDRGHFHSNIELMIIVVIIAILAAIAIPAFLNARAARGPKCLEQLMSLSAGALPANTTCPYGGKAYATSPGDLVACPSPADHLDSNPRFVRAKDGAWRLEQTLSAYAGGPVEVGDGRTAVEQAEGRTTLRTWRAGIVHHVVAWIFLIALGLPALLLLGLGARLLLKSEWGAAGAVLAGAAVFAVLVALLLATYTSRTSFVLDRAAASVTRVEHKFGRLWSTTTYAGCLGVVPVPSTSSGKRLLQLVHAPNADGKRTTPLEEISADRLDLADWLNRALLP